MCHRFEAAGDGTAGRGRAQEWRQHQGRTDAHLHPICVAACAQAFSGSRSRLEISITEAYSGVLTEIVLKGALDFAVVPAFAGMTAFPTGCWVRDGNAGSCQAEQARRSEAGSIVRARSTQGGVAIS